MRSYLAMTTLAVVAWTGPVLARAMEPEAARLTAQWSELNSECRGRSGDLPETQRACARRDRLTRLALRLAGRADLQQLLAPLRRVRPVRFRHAQSDLTFPRRTL